MRTSALTLGPAGRRMRIGISTRFVPAAPNALGAAREPAFSVHDALLASCRGMGGLPLSLCAPTDATDDEIEREAADAVATVDALVLGGGGDVVVGPQGQMLCAPGHGSLRARDRFEYALLAHASVAGLPVLGICRGAQLIQLAYGGGLQHEVDFRRPDGISFSHSAPPRYVEHSHALDLTEHGMLAAAFGRQSGIVNSAHRWCIARLAPALTTEAICPVDGSVEAFSRSGGAWLLGLMWHPEFDRESSERLAGSVVWQLFREAIVRRHGVHEGQRTPISWPALPSASSEPGAIDVAA